MVAAIIMIATILSGHLDGHSDTLTLVGELAMAIRITDLTIMDIITTMDGTILILTTTMATMDIEATTQVTGMDITAAITVATILNVTTGFIMVADRQDLLTPIMEDVIVQA